MWDTEFQQAGGPNIGITVNSSFAEGFHIVLLVHCWFVVRACIALALHDGILRLPSLFSSLY